MISRFPVPPIAAAAAALLLAPASFASDNDDLRTADDAKAMLTKAVAAVKADKAKALDMFNNGNAASVTATSMCLASISATASSWSPATLIQKIF